MDEKILTLHPDPAKQGVRISKAKYDAVREAVLEALKTTGALTLDELNQHTSRRLRGQFEGSIPWYVVTVKLDLEARGIIERTKESPHRVRLKS